MERPNLLIRVPHPWKSLDSSTSPSNPKTKSNTRYYYLAESSSTLPTETIADVNLLDAMPSNTTFIPNSSLISRSSAPLTNSDTFFSPLQSTPNPSPCVSPTNNNGSILYSLGNLSTQTGQNLGYTRFRTRVNGAQP